MLVLIERYGISDFHRHSPDFHLDAGQREHLHEFLIEVSHGAGTASSNWPQLSWCCGGSAQAPQARPKENRAARIAGALLFVLAPCVVMVSALSLLGYGEPKPSVTGIVILLLAAVVMPLLAREKRRLSAATGSAALRADAAESAVCAYLSVLALLGVGLNTVWHVSWADPVAALVIVPFIVREGREAMRGKTCSCQ